MRVRVARVRLLTFPGRVGQQEHLLHSLPRRAPHYPVPLCQRLLRRTPQLELELGGSRLVFHVRKNQLRDKLFLHSS